MNANTTSRDRYLCRSCGGVTVHLTAEEAAVERKEGHEIELWIAIENAAGVKSSN